MIPPTRPPALHPHATRPLQPEYIVHRLRVAIFICLPNNGRRLQLIPSSSFFFAHRFVFVHQPAMASEPIENIAVFKCNTENGCSVYLIGIDRDFNESAQNDRLVIMVRKR